MILKTKKLILNLIIIIALILNFSCSCTKKTIKIKKAIKKKMKNSIKIDKKKRVRKDAKSSTFVNSFKQNKSFFKDDLYYAYETMAEDFVKIRALVKFKKYDEALVYLSRLYKSISSRNEQSIIIYEMAEIYMKKKDYKNAQIAYEEIIKKYKGYKICENAEEGLEFLQNKSYNKNFNLKYTRKDKKE